MWSLINQLTLCSLSIKLNSKLVEEVVRGQHALFLGIEGQCPTRKIFLFGSTQVLDGGLCSFSNRGGNTSVPKGCTMALESINWTRNNRQASTPVLHEAVSQRQNLGHQEDSATTPKLIQKSLDNSGANAQALGRNATTLQNRRVCIRQFLQVYCVFPYVVKSESEVSALE